MRSWRRNPDSGLEAELRANRPEPSPELVDRLEMHVRTHGRGRRAGSFRVAFAGALVVGLMASLASVGGLGYAATGANQAVHTAKSVMHVHAVATLKKSAAQDQYRKPKAEVPQGHSPRQGRLQAGEAQEGEGRQVPSPAVHRLEQTTCGAAPGPPRRTTTTRDHTDDEDTAGVRRSPSRPSRL